jgi:hypothetical protein
LRRNRVAIDGNESIGRFASADLLGDSLAKLIHRFGHQISQFVPVGLFGMTLDFLSFPANTVAKPSRLGSHLRVVEQFLDITHPVGPFAESFAPYRSTRSPSRPLSIGIGQPATTAVLRVLGAIIRRLAPFARARVAATQTSRRLLALTTWLTLLTTLSLLLTLLTFLALLLTVSLSPLIFLLSLLVLSLALTGLLSSPLLVLSFTRLLSLALTLPPALRTLTLALAHWPLRSRLPSLLLLAFARRILALF